MSQPWPQAEATWGQGCAGCRPGGGGAPGCGNGPRGATGAAVCRPPGVLRGGRSGPPRAERGPAGGPRRVSLSLLRSLRPCPPSREAARDAWGPEHSHQSQVACAAVSASGLEGEDRARVRSTCVKCCEQLPAGRGHSAPAGPLLLALGKRVTPASRDFLRFPPCVPICLLPGSPGDEMR